MNDDYVVRTSVLIDDLLQVMDYRDDSRAYVKGAEIMACSVSARCFDDVQAQMPQKWQSLTSYHQTACTEDTIMLLTQY